jgi:16S rRNA (cytosine967-C5)-methyltransferase
MSARDSRRANARPIVEQDPRRMPAGVASRSVALDVLMAVDDDDAYANLLLPVRIARAGLSTQDAAFATELTYGTLRRRGTYDVVIELAAVRVVEAIDDAVLQALRLGTHQLLGMRVSPHAAVAATVEALKPHVGRGAVGFTNGVLRSIAREDAEVWIERAVATATSGEQALAIRYSHPLWVVRALRQSLVSEGRESELEAALAADNVAPRVSMVALPGLATVEELAGRPGLVSPIAAVLAGGDPADVPAVKAGRARVQDEGSQLAALALSRARPIAKGEVWLDLCAGPGGKAALLAAEAAAGGAVLDANELVPARAGLVRQALVPFGDAVEVTVEDGTTVGERTPATYDRILLDAPCTGLGALRRRPEARWRKQPSDVAGLGEIQSKLLTSAAAALKPGGLLAYVTCSPHMAETKAIVKAALRSVPGLSIVPTQPVLQSIATEELDLPAADHVQLWPHRHGTDAMFIQLLTRSPA